MLSAELTFQPDGALAFSNLIPLIESQIHPPAVLPPTTVPPLLID
jgi:hypothetical protein